METEMMGRVVTEATIENLNDLYAAAEGRLKVEDVRRVVVGDALVDTGATSLAMPVSLITKLGLRKRYRKRARTSVGTREVDVYEAVRLTIQGRDCTVDVVEIPDETPVLVGQIPLEFLDFVVDPRSQRLIGNPAHGGEQVLELY